MTRDEKLKLGELQRASQARPKISAHYPEEFAECTYCGNPTSTRLCDHCEDELKRLTKKAQEQSK